MIIQNPTPQGSQAFSEILFRALGLISYWRLILLLGIFSLSLGLAALSYAPKVYMAQGIIRYDILRHAVQNEKIANIPSPHDYTTLYRSLLTRLRSPYLTKLTATKLGAAKQGDSFQDVLAGVFPKIRIDPMADGFLLATFEAYDPAVCRGAPEALVDAYNQDQMRVHEQRRNKRLAAYNQELEALQKKVDQSLEESSGYIRENAFLESFIEQNQLTEVPREMIIIKHRLGMLEQIKDVLEKNSQDIISKLSLISSFEKEPTLSVGQVVSSVLNDKDSPLRIPAQNASNQPGVGPTIVAPGLLEGPEPWRELERQYRQVNEEISRASTVYLPGHKVMRDLTEKQQSLLSQLETELQKAVRRLELEEVFLVDKQKKLQTQLPEYNKVMKDYEDFMYKFSLLKKDKESWSLAYQQLRDRIKALDFEGDRENVSVSFQGLVSDEITPVSPNRMKILYASLGMALILGIGVPTAMEFLKDSSSRLHELEQRLDISGLGIVPLVESVKLEKVVRCEDATKIMPDFLLESFRIIRGGLTYRLKGPNAEPPQIILVSSARPGEGKTTISASLAWAFASIGEKTLLIDADLRRGRQHKVFELPNTDGLCSVLVGEASLDNVIRKSAVPNLDVITRGRIIPNAAEYFCRSEFDEIITQCRSKYQRIIIDSPPILGLSEAISLQRTVDGVLLVVKASDTPIKIAQDAVESLQKVGAKVLGFALNQIDLSTASNSYNYYYYSSAYYPHHHEAEAET